MLTCIFNSSEQGIFSRGRIEQNIEQYITLQSTSVEQNRAMSRTEFGKLMEIQQKQV